MHYTQRLKIGAIVLVIGLVSIFALNGGNRYIVPVTTQGSSDAAHALVQPVQNISGVSAYTDPKYGFGIQYPSLLNLQTSNLDIMTYFSGKSAETRVFIQDSTKYRESLTISASSDKGDVAQCLVTPKSEEDSVTKGATTTINDVPFFTYTTGDTSTGHLTDTQVYRALRGNDCFEISKVINRENPNRLSGDEQKKQSEDLATASAEIDPILYSFRFVPNVVQGH